MSAADELETSLSKIEAAQDAAYTKSLANIDKLLEMVSTLTEGSEETSGNSKKDQSNTFAKTASDVQKSTSKLFKQYHNSVISFGKAVDKHLYSNLESCCQSEPLNSALLEDLVTDYLLRQGKLELAGSILGGDKDLLAHSNRAGKLLEEEDANTCEDASFACSNDEKQNQSTEIKEDALNRGTLITNQFEEMHTIVRALRNKSAQPALSWVKKYREDLKEDADRNVSTQMEIDADATTSIDKKCAPAESVGSRTQRRDDVTNGLHNLEFDLHRLCFLRLLSPAVKLTSSIDTLPESSEQLSNTACLDNSVDIAACQCEALSYSRLHFPRYLSTHKREIEKCTSCLLFVNNESTLPECYTYLFSDELWLAAENAFNVEYFGRLGLPHSNPLMSSVVAGTLTLPKALKYKKMVKEVDALVDSNSLQLDVDLGLNLQFHTTFVCPINKVQTTKTNPPVLLKCGHVISKGAMLKISKASRFKCPTCPCNQLPSESVTLNF